MFYDKKARSNYYSSSSKISSGAPSTIAENFSQQFEQQSLNESTLGYHDRLDEYDSQNRALVRELTGEKIEPLLFKTAENGIGVEDIRDNEEQINQRLAQLQKKFPQIKTRAELRQRVQKEAQETEIMTADIDNRATIIGKLAGFAGSTIASINPETDPINFGFSLPTLGMGGVGKNLLIKMLKEAGFDTAVETINQYTGVAKNRELLGLPNSTERMLTNIAAAAAGGALLRGTGRTAKAGYKKLKEVDFQGLKASEILNRFKPNEQNSADIALRNALEREAMDESFSMTSPEVFTQSKAKLERVGAELHSGKSDIEDDVFSYNPERAGAEVATIAETFDFDIKEAARIEAEVRKYGSFEPDTVSQISMMPARTLREFVEDSINKVKPELNRTATRVARALDDESAMKQLKSRAYDQGYFPEYKKAADIPDQKFRDVIKEEDAGIYRYDANTRDAMEAEIEASQRHYDEYVEAKTQEAMDREEALSKYYEETEIAELDRAVNEFRQSERVVNVEMTDGTIQQKRVAELIDELDSERAVLDALTVCSL